MSNQRDIFAIVGLPPEVLAVAMAKYSRTSRSIKETIDELTEEQSADFHEKWVLGYGDASVADMAVIAIALEGVSTLATKVIQDNRLASYQEKSSRYVKFKSDMFYTPASIASSKHAEAYTETMKRMMAAYSQLTTDMMEHYRSVLDIPKDLDGKAVNAKLKARSLDVARYLQPTALTTNFGMIINARSLRHAISKMLGSPLEELQEIGREVQAAATKTAYNPPAAKMEIILDKLAETIDDTRVIDEILATVKLQVKGAPTLIKYTEPKEYYAKFDRYAHDLAREVLDDLGDPEKEPGAVLHEPASMEQDFLTTVLYAQSHYSYRQIATVVEHMNEQKRKNIIEDLIALRGSHDWPRREYEVGQQLVFDTMMIWGAFYDLQRHRLCTQINQQATILHGYEEPRDLAAAGQAEDFHALMQQHEDIARRITQDFPHEAAYLVTKGHYKRTLFKMNLRELFHIAELRTKPGGHFAYRSIAYQMYEEFKKKHPDLAIGIRAVKMDYLNEFFQR